jgi:DNA (cytosine-5)-methyltransferase 1
MLACEWDQHAVDTYRANFPSTDVFHGDIAKLSVDEVLRRTGLKPGELDIFDGSPPCQGFSTCGRRNFADPRNQLFKEYCRLIRGLRPKTFVMENVSGMVKGDMKFAFAVILRELKSCGYRVKVRLLNAAFFGVPQARQRIIFIGVRDDLGIEPSFPAPITSPISARAALIGLENNPAEIAMLLAAGKHYSAMKDWAKIPVGSNRQKAGLGSGFNAVKFHPDKPAQTIRKMDGNLGMHGCMHWAEQRRFTIGEFKRFCSFPDDFKFIGNFLDKDDYGEAVARMGNCVPPLFMKAIAAHIRDAILSQIPKGE